jgi:hypothetical protein
MIARHDVPPRACGWTVARSLAAILVAVSLTACGTASSPRRVTQVRTAEAASHRPAPGCAQVMRLSAGAPVRVGKGAGAILADAGAVWVARAQAGTVTRITAGGQSVVDLGGAPVSLAAGFGQVWVALRDGNRVAALDPSTLRRSLSTPLRAPVSVVAGPAEMWALSLDDAAVYPIGPTPGVLGSPVYAPVTAPSEMVLVGSDMWVLGGTGGLSPVNLSLGRIVQSGVSLPGRSLAGLSGSDGALWLGEPGRGDLVRLDRGMVSARELSAPDGLRPSSTAAGRCGVWVAEDSGRVALIDPNTGAPIGPAVRIGHSIAALAPSGTGVWASDPVDGTIVYVVARPAA